MPSGYNEARAPCAESCAVPSGGAARSRKISREKEPVFELENALDEYLSHLRIERGASPRTAEAYRRDLEDYLAFLDGEGVEGFGDIDREKVAAFERSLMEQNLAVTTVRRRISAVRG